MFSFSEVEPGFFSVFDAASGELSSVLGLQKNPPQRGVVVKQARFNAEDGTTLVGWITYVPRRPIDGRQALPIVVLIGTFPYEPWAGTYNDLAHFLASRDYVVLQLNHRGTSGHGLAFLEKGKAHLGAAVPADLAAAAAELAESEHIDGSRVAVIGSGYGAHLTLRTLASDKGRFACGVAISPVVDWGAIARSHNSDIRRQWFTRTKLLKASDDSRELTACSAVAFADDLTAPLLIIQGAADTVAPNRPVSRFVKRLRKAGVPVEQLIIKRAGHCVPEDEPRVEMFERIETFLAQHLSMARAASAPDSKGP